MGYLVYVTNSSGEKKLEHEFQGYNQVKAHIQNLRNSGFCIWSFRTEFVGPRARVQLRAPANYSIWDGR